MATREYWIQIENRAWDMMPNGVDRMTGDRKQAQSRLLRWVTADPRGHPVDIRDPVEVEMYAPVEALYSGDTSRRQRLTKAMPGPFRMTGAQIPGI